MSKENKILMFIVAVAFLLRLAPIFFLHYPVINDAAAYNDIGWNLAGHFSYSRDGITPTIERPPGYPVVLAGVYFIFGHNVLAVLVMQIIISALSVYLIYLLARFFTEEKWALVCAGVAAIYPMFIYYNLFLYSENWAIFSCLLFLLFLFKGLKEKRGWLVLSSLFFISFLLTKPLFAPVLGLVLVLFIVMRKQVPVKYSIVLFLLPVILVWGVWIGRNYAVFHKPIPFGIGLGPVLFVGNYPAFNGVWPENYSEVIKAANLSANLPEIEQDNFLKQKAMEQIKQHPADFIGLTFLKIEKYLVFVKNFSGSVIYKEGSGKAAVVFSAIFVVYVFYKAVISLLFLAGSGIILWEWKKTKNYLIMFLLLMAWYAILAHALIYVDERYHLPTFALHILVAAIAGRVIINRFTNTAGDAKIKQNLSIK